MKSLIFLFFMFNMPLSLAANVAEEKAQQPIVCPYFTELEECMKDENCLQGTGFTEPHLVPDEVKSILYAFLANLFALCENRECALKEIASAKAEHQCTTSE